MTPDELRAIRERWPEGRCANSDARADVLALLDEVERLTRERDAEIASLTAALDERDVEAERVREQYDALAKERDEARAEVERLTEELKVVRAAYSDYVRRST